MTTTWETRCPAGGSRRPWRSVAVQLVRFTLVGAVVATANTAIYLLARIWSDPQLANVIGIVLSTMVSTTLHRRYTFGGATAHRWRLHAQTAGAAAYYVFSGAAALFLLELIVEDSTPALESVAVAVAGGIAALGRFVVLRNWALHLPADADASKG